MSTIPYSPTEVAALRKEVLAYDIKLSSTTAWELLRLVGNRHICVDALLMEKRPAWLEKIVGPVAKIAAKKS